MTWRPPGKDAHPNRWRYDLRRGFVPPGHSTDPQGTQYEMQQGFDPQGSPRGFHVVESPPGTAAPIGAINYTPDTREVHDVGALAPVDKKNLSLIPDSGLHKLAYNRRQQRQSAVGAGHDQQQPFPGTPPLSSNFPNPQQQRPSQQPVWPSSGMSPTSAPPGAPFGRQPLGIGAGADDDETDPTAGVDQASAPTTEETTGGADPNWQNVGPEYTGHRRIDSTHVAEMVDGKPLGIWIKKPGATDLDPNAWSFRSAPSKVGDKTTWKEEPQPDGSIIMRASNGDVKRIAAPKGPTGQSGIQYGAPHRDEAGNLVQTGSNGEVRVIERSPTARAPTTTWGQPYQAPDGSYVQQSSTGELRAVPGTKPSTATEKWGPPESKPDGSIWQQNTSTGKWEIIQSPDTKLTDPFTVGNRLVKFDPESNSYKEVYRAPQNMSLQTLANGSIVGIDQETGEQTPILDDPTAAAAAGLKQRQGEQGLRAGEADIRKTEMGMIPQPYISGGNLMVPEGAEADVSDWNPLTGRTSQRTVGHHRTIPDILQGYGFEQPPAQPTTYRPPAAPGASTPSSVPDASPIPSGDGATVNGVLAPGVTGTSADPMLRADTAGYTPPPETGPQGGTDWLFSSPASPVANVANTPQAPPAAEEPPPEEGLAEEPPSDDGTLVDDMGAGADRGRSDQQSDLMRDIPRFAHKRRWKGLGSKFLGRGLEEFQPFVGVGQDGGPEPPAGPLPSPPPPAGSGGAAIPPPPAGGGLGGPPPAGMSGKPPGNWDPQKLQQLIPLLLMLLSGGSGGGARGGLPPATPGPAPAATPPVPGGAAPGIGGPPGGMGMGQDATRFDPSTVLRPTESGPTQVNPWREFGPRMLPGVLEGGPTMLPQMPGESGPGMLDTSPVSSTIPGRGPLNPRDLSPVWPGGEGRWATPGVNPQGGSQIPFGGMDSERFEQMPFDPAYGAGDPTRPMVQSDVGDIGTGQDQPQGFQPPIDPQHVVGTGHKFGQAMNAGDPVHRGVDLQAPKGTPVKAPVDGVVRVSRNPQGLGNEVIVVSPDGKEHKLGHLNTVSVKPGQQVKAGQPVGTVGDSGLTTGANLHYAEKKGGRYFNPSGKMGVMADLPPAPGTQMMSADGASGGGPGAGQDMVPADREDRMAPQLPYAPVDGSPDILPSDISSWQSQARRWQRDVAMPSPGLVYRPQTDAPWKSAPYAFPVEPGGDDGVVAGAGQDDSIDPGSNFSSGSWSSGPGGQIQTRTQQLINSGVDPATAYNQASSAVSAGGRGYTGPSSGGGGGGGTNVSIDPATQARLQLDTQVAQWDHDQKSASLQQSVRAEDDRHAEELQRLQQSAAQEADWRAVQDAVNAENARHNQAQEQLTRQQQQLDVQLEQMKEQFQAGQTAQTNALSTMQSALSNPWLQALTKLGITPGGGASGGANPLMNLINAVLGGATGGNLANTGAFAGAQGAQLPAVTPQQWAQMTVPQKAAMRAQVEAMGPGMWQQFQSNFQNQAGTSQAPDQTQMQAAVATPEDQLGTQMSAEMFGEGQPAFQQRQQRSWAPAQGSNVMQSLLAGTGFG